MKNVYIAIAILVMVVLCTILFLYPTNEAYNNDADNNVVEKVPLADANEPDNGLIDTGLKGLTFRSYIAEDNELPRNKDYIIEVVSYECEHCLNLTKELATLDYDVVQYFIGADENNISDFIAKLDEYPETQILYGCEGFEKQLKAYELDAVPIMIFMGADNKVKAVHVGYVPADTIVGMYNNYLGTSE